ncbi:hypothetical protein E2562_004642 [Oryza meyeriana var. granulata]|uniref:Uncharacterized protein n=1 Tax=Oryza meyeriana var. granulata TaxID=110450 RepID=A0A6G1DDX5_9ORYZ|nr:hypothetical protein E2562_004642 [Oryza meyeriana var. granulata]
MAGSDWQGEVTSMTGGEEEKATGREDGARRRRSADGGARVRGGLDPWGQRGKKTKERELTGEKGSRGGRTGAARVRA